MSDKIEVAEELELRKEENTQIFDYLKLHPSVLITCISVLLAFASGIINVLVDSQVYKVLNYWGFTNISVNTTNPHLVYRIILSAVLSIVCVMATNSFDFMSKKYFKQTEILRKLNQITNIVGKELRCRKKKINELRNKINGYQGESDDIKAIINSVKLLEEQQKNIVYRNNETRRVLKKANFATLLALLVIVIAVAFLFGFIFCVIFSLMMTETSLFRYIALAGIVFSVVTCASAFIFAYLDRPRYTQKELKSIVKDYGNLDNVKSIVELELEKLSEKLDKLQLENDRIAYFSNKNIYIGLVYFVVVLGMIVLQGMSTVNTNLEKQNDFNIYYDADKAYIIVYSNDDVFFMDEAELSGDTIVIDTEKHRIISSSDIHFENHTFSEVALKKDIQEETVFTTEIENSTPGDETQ